jgi:GNAT superfamily N-acetyltransferase
VPKFHITHLDREAYLSSVAVIGDLRTRRFAELSLHWWDRHFSWRAQGCSVLCNEQNDHLCYLFYKIDRYGDYITFHNIFTPKAERRQGYASALLGMIFSLAVSKHVRRFRITCVSQALDFYLPLGFAYWGVNSIGDYYCDLPVPDSGLDGLDAMVRNTDTETLAGSAAASIRNKVDDNEMHLDAEQVKIYDNDVQKMGRRYMHDAFNALEE